MKFIKTFLFCLLLTLSGYGLFAQQKPNNFSLFFEKVYLHTDRDVYIQGDTIWFKAYLLNGQNNMPIGTSGNLYVELISAKPEMLSRQIVRLEAGSGHGDFRLTDSIPSGRYTLRAYTNWMRNFGDNFVFEKHIDIYNTQPPGKVAVAVAAVKPDRAKAKATVQSPVVHVNNISVRFFPEGGSLVEGLNSLVGVKAEDAAGNGVVLKGAVLNTTGDTVSRFSSDTLGMGMLSLLPLSGQTYKAWFNYKGTEYVVALPQPLIKGLSLSVRKSDTLVTAFVCANNIAAADYQGHNLTLIARHGGKAIFAKAMALADNQAVLRVSASLFPEGISSITVYDDQNKPNCERLVYIHHPDKAPLTIATDKPGYQPKGKVTLKLKLADTSAKANLSLAVVDAGVVPKQEGNIANYLLLSSELKGDIAHPERYFDTTNVNRSKQLDLLLMTQGWRDFVWRRVADSAIRVTYAAEPYITLSGRVRQKFANKPLKDMSINLTALKARGNKIFNSKTDSTGKYYFDALQLYGPQVVSLTALDSKGKSAGWISMDSLYQEPMPLRVEQVVPVDTASRTEKAIVKAITDRQKIRRKYSNSDTIHLMTVEIKAPKIVQLKDGGRAISFGYPDQVFKITKADEYFESLSNWMIHNVKGAQPSRSGEDDAVVFSGYIGVTTPAWLQPTFFINGKQVDHLLAIPPYIRKDFMATYYNLSMDKVKKVIVRHMIGTVIDYRGNPRGVDVYLTYLTVTDDAFDKVEFGKLTAQVNGYDEPRTFYKPLYDTSKDLNKPDYRTTLHWEPNVTTSQGEATVTFYNADPKTTVRVVVQGVTDKGMPVYNTTTYTVK